jgi:hypothetical protein
VFGRQKLARDFLPAWENSPKFRRKVFERDRPVLNESKLICRKRKGEKLHQFVFSFVFSVLSTEEKDRW